MVNESKIYNPYLYCCYLGNAFLQVTDTALYVPQRIVWIPPIERSIFETTARKHWNRSKE